ncbi:hypothetical protein AK830_g6939 [Neonectria ditissima]|uniref:Uncharacterized protein n=1 Tax=Neonectria ditissima TaxID=78410 RepID=A0A0N8H6Q0_9HYPO|nr:hypothetical protein AK830_g6939 [Neonectria ditissima]
MSPDNTPADGLDAYDYRISLDTLKYIGLDDNAANIIWSRWVNLGIDEGREVDGGPVTFLSMARAYIRGAKEDASSDDDASWYTAMASIGVNESLQAAIMTPRCKDARYDGLIQIQAASRERSRAASRPGQTQRQSISPGSPIPTRFRTTSELLPGGPSLSPMTTSAPEVRASAPGHTVLYKGLFKTRADPLFNEEGQIVNLGCLSSSVNGDFHSRPWASSMVVDFEIANKYAHFAKVRDSNQLAVIVRVEIPNSALESLDDTQKLSTYWPSQGWKELVWKCRKGIRLRDEWTKFRNATLAIGTICGKPDMVINALDSPSDITHNMVLQGPRGDAIQYVFIGNQGEEFLERFMSSNITVHPMTRQVVEEMELKDS